jgi:hypothetical protein
MKFRDRLRAIQVQTQCNHVKELGVPCDRESGGWWTCGCAVMADKQDTSEHISHEGTPDHG